MSRRFRSRMLGFAVLSACGFTGGAVTGNGDGGIQIPIDATVIDVLVPDAAMCAAGTPDECIAMDTRVRRCLTEGAPPVDELCPGGCTTTGGPHCLKLTPTGGTVTPADLVPDGALQDITWQLMFVDGRIDTGTGEIVINGQTVRAAGNGIRNGIYFQQRGNVGVFRMNRLAITSFGASLEVTGPNALALVAIYDMSIIGELDVQGACGSLEAGPGGGAGGNEAAPGGGSGAGGAGSGSNSDCSGGGGGGHAGSGGFGGSSTQNRGTTFGAATITTLVGGGGGGGGGGNGGNGGGGGGAVQLVANGKIVLGSSSLFQRFGGINAGGCGGETAAACGGGGGAGGTILIEAAVVELRKMTLAANGGGGGGGSNGQNGNDGRLSNQRADGGGGGGGGQGGQQGGDGGDGGYDTTADGTAGQDDNLAGGGGGGVGRIRINTRSGTAVQDSAVISPRLSTGASAPASLGTAAIQ